MVYTTHLWWWMGDGLLLLYNHFESFRIPVLSPFLTCHGPHGQLPFPKETQPHSPGLLHSALFVFMHSPSLYNFEAGWKSRSPHCSAVAIPVHQLCNKLDLHASPCSISAQTSLGISGWLLRNASLCTLKNRGDHLNFHAFGILRIVKGHLTMGTTSFWRFISRIHEALWCTSLCSSLLIHLTASGARFPSLRNV